MESSRVALSELHEALDLPDGSPQGRFHWRLAKVHKGIRVSTGDFPSFHVVCRGIVQLPFDAEEVSAIVGDVHQRHLWDETFQSCEELGGFEGTAAVVRRWVSRGAWFVKAREFVVLEQVSETRGPQDELEEWCCWSTSVDWPVSTEEEVRVRGTLRVFGVRIRRIQPSGSEVGLVMIADLGNTNQLPSWILRRAAELYPTVLSDLRKLLVRRSLIQSGMPKKSDVQMDHENSHRWMKEELGVSPYLLFIGPLSLLLLLIPEMFWVMCVFVCLLVIPKLGIHAITGNHET